MRLLHASSFQLKSFEGDAIPPYAILSHTWGEDEVSFQDIHGPDASSKVGFKKIQLICSHALEHGLQYVWVDTCCIDKTSSAELSEAINSMFRWYQKSRYCYAYLADVPDGTDVHSPSSTFATSRWFSRGWTLQELLAPIHLEFFSSGGQELGSRQTLSGTISSITLIGEEYLSAPGPNSLLEEASIAKRMSWCSCRNTTRIEDIAYCLLGIFGINMPLLYGEGERAFVRLQEEIMKVSNDQSLFAWEYESYNTSASLVYLDNLEMNSLGPLARHPSAFKYSGHFVPDELEPPKEAFASTNMGLQITL
ncbi:Heterokaryon incompatibility protein (HET) domain containing protein, partial [Hyaloscypha variabilis]